jgi:hypothetical protein
MTTRSTALLLGLFLGLAGLPSAPAQAAPSPPPAETAGALEAARSLAREAMGHYDAGRFVDAAETFRRADALHAAPQYRVYIARSYVRLGKTATAARFYESAAALPAPPSAPATFRDAQATAATELGELKRRVAVLRIVVVGPPARASSVTVDGAPFPGPGPDPVELDPGPHTVEATAPGFERQTRTIEVHEGDSVQADLVLHEVARDPAPEGDAKPAGRRPSEAPAGDAPGRAPESARSTAGDHAAGRDDTTHHHQLGAIARGDVDVLHAGAVAAVGPTFGLTDVDLAVLALLGRHQGVEPGATVYVLRGRWKPMVSFGVPIFFVDGARFGVRGAAGLQWDPLRHLGVFLQAGAAYFPSLPVAYTGVSFLPSAGIQGRL